MRIQAFIFGCFLSCCMASAFGQCEFPIDSIDEFDSTRLVAFQPITIGYLIPSQVETAEGPLLVEEAKFMFTFTQNDTLNSFFMTIAVAEREYLPIQPGFNVLLKLSNGQIVGLYNVPDKGTFDANTNMRVYQHTAVVPLDLFYNLTHHKIEKIRIRYRNKKQTITLLPEQQEEVRKAVQCIGEAVNLFPIKP